MSDITPAPEGVDPYFTTDDSREAVGALEATAVFLAEAEHEPATWRWVIIALHGAVQGFMVSTLKGSDTLGAFDQKSIDRRLTARRAFDEARTKGDDKAAHTAQQEMLFSDVRLAAFLTLYERIKADDWYMMQYVTTQVYEPRQTDDRCMHDLNRVRNDFIHFKPMLRGMLLTQFPAIAETGLHVINFLLHESNNILWANGYDPYGLTDRSNTALAQAAETMSRINAKYVDLPRPRHPLCGADS